MATTTATAPCFCEGPWLDVEPADRPASGLAREHATGDAGCIYVSGVGLRGSYQGTGNRPCPYCNRIMSHREAAEQGACNDCYGS